MAEQFPVPPANQPVEPVKKSNRTLIIIIVVILVICCCCVVAGGLLWTYGDALIDWLGQILGF